MNDHLTHEVSLQIADMMETIDHTLFTNSVIAKMSYDELKTNPNFTRADFDDHLDVINELLLWMKQGMMISGKLLNNEALVDHTFAVALTED